MIYKLMNQIVVEDFIETNEFLLFGQSCKQSYAIMRNVDYVRSN